MTVPPTQRVVERHRFIALALRNGQQSRFCAGAGMGINRASLQDRKTGCGQRLKTGVIVAAGNRTGDLCIEQLFERLEQDPLQVQGHGEQPVQKRRDRRQLILDAIAVHQFQARCGFKSLQ